MTTTNLKREFHKVKESFNKVKTDMNKLYSVIDELRHKVDAQESTIKILNNELDELRLNKIIKDTSRKDDEEKTIVGNIESKKFHYINCPYAKNIKGDNKIVFEGIEQAVKAGYNECSCIRDN